MRKHPDAGLGPVAVHPAHSRVGSRPMAFGFKKLEVAKQKVIKFPTIFGLRSSVLQENVFAQKWYTIMPLS